MNKLLKTFAFATATLCLNSIPTHAQEESETVQDAAFSTWNISLNGGLTFAATDVNNSKTGSIFGIGAGFQPLSFLQINLDIQKGLLQEGDHDNNQTMHFKNNYIYGSLTARFHPLALILKDEYSSFKNTLYVGTGIALTKSNVDANNINNPDVGYIDNYKGTDVFVPLELGVQYPVWNSKVDNQLINLNLNFRHHLGFADQLDGYEPQVSNNKKNDVFSQITLGISYNF